MRYKIINSIWEKRCCPICKSSLLDEQPEVSAKFPAEHLSWSEVKNKFVGIRHEQIFFSYYRCRKCFLLYCPWYFTEEQVLSLYAHMPDNSMGEDDKSLELTSKYYAKNILKYSKSISNFLEIGPDLGYLTKAIINSSHLNFVSVVEPNLNIHSKLKRNIGKLSHYEIVQSLNKVAITAYDLTVGIHILDHLIKPSDNLRTIYNLLNCHSTVAFVVHNEKSILRFLMHKTWPPFCLQHPQLYNKKTLLLLMKQSNFSQIKFKDTVNFYHINNLVSLLLKINNRSAIIQKFVPKVRIPIPLGNIMVIAKRLD